MEKTIYNLSTIRTRQFGILAIMLLFSCYAFSQSTMFRVHPTGGGTYNSTFANDAIMKKKWSIKTGGKIFGSASVNNGIAYFGSDDSCMYAVNSLGELQWKFKSDGKIRSTPAVADTMLYFNSYGGTFYALHALSGSQFWQFETEGEGVFTALGINGNTPKDQMLEDPWDVYQSSPIYIDSVIYFGCGKNMYALNRFTGTQLWKYSAPNVIHSSPALSNNKLYFGCWDSKLYALDATNGSLLWEYQTGLDPTNNLMAGIQSSPLIVDTLVVVGSRDGNVYGINANTGEKIWKTGFSGSWMTSSFAVVNDTIYTGSSDAASFFALNKLTGEIIFSIRFPSFMFSTPAYSNGIVFIGCTNGSVYNIDVNKRRIVSRFDTDGHKKNPLSALKADGTFDYSVFPNSPEYSENVRWNEILYSAGSIFASPVIENNIVYFGSTDSCFYAIEDNEQCKPNFKTSTDKIEFEFPTLEKFDTTISITHLNECSDTVYATIIASSTLTNAISFENSEMVFLNENELNFKMTIDFSQLNSTKQYKGIVRFSSKMNEYNYVESELLINASTVGLINTQLTRKIDIFPNPFTNSTTIKISSENASTTEVRIYDINGNLVKILFSGTNPKGTQSFEWDATTQTTQMVKSGIYFCKIIQGNEVSIKKLVKT